MTEKPKERPQVSAAGEQASLRREERLAAALRANLSRRKAQARQRGEEAPAGEDKGWAGHRPRQLQLEPPRRIH
jgi:hypothetical protein